MGTTADKLNKLLETKEAIKLAIRDKGVYIGDYDAFAEYPDAIRSIETSSGEGGSDEFFNMRTQNGTNFSNLFYFYGGSELDVSGFDTSNVTNMYNMFYGCDNLTSLDVSGFDTNNVTNMYQMFYSCGNLTSLDVSGFDTSKVTTMSGMFGSCSRLTSLDVSNFNTSNVTDMSYMFSWCTNLEELDIRNFDMNNIEYSNCMFESCRMLHKLRLDNCGYDTINKIINSANFPTGQVNVDGEDINRKMYIQEANAAGLTAPDGWEFVSADSDDNEIVPEPEEPEIPLYEVGMFSNAENKTELTEVNVMVNSSHTDLSNMFNGCYNLQTINNIEQWDTSNVTNMEYMFNGCTNLTSLDLSGFDTGNVTNMQYIFAFNSNLTELNLSNFDASNVTKTDNIFWNCNALHTLRLDNCSNDTIRTLIESKRFPTNAIEGVTRKMYVNPDNIEGLTPPTNWIFVDSDGNEIGGEEEPEIYVPDHYRDNMEITEATTMVNDTHTDLSYMFSNCENLQTINNIEQWDTSNVMYMNHMFEQCHNLISLDLSSFNTSNVYNMGFMFFDCNSLKTLDISNFNMSKVEENVDFMFSGCDNLRVLRLDNCDRNTIERIINNCNLPTGDKDGISRLMYVQEANIINPDNQDERLTAPDGWRFVYVAGNPQDTYDSDSKPFRGDRDIQEVNVAVTKQHDNLSEMFRDCENLEVIHNIDTWDTGNVTSMSEMFSNCRKLIELDLSSWYTGYVTNMNNMFERCENLIYLDIRNFDISDSTEIGDMFIGCDRLQVLRLDNCTNSVIERIINDTGLPTGNIDGRLRKMYLPEKYATNPEESGLTVPDGWEFAFVQAKEE